MGSARPHSELWVCSTSPREDSRRPTSNRPVSADCSTTSSAASWLKIRLTELLSIPVSRATSRTLMPSGAAATASSKVNNFVATPRCSASAV